MKEIKNVFYFLDMFDLNQRLFEKIFKYLILIFNY